MFTRLTRPLFQRLINMRRDQFEQLPVPARRLLFLGDSITEGGNWQEWFPDHPTLNRGIAGDTVNGVHTRLETAVNDPLAISLLIGTNDLAGHGATRRVDAIADQFAALVEAIVALAPSAPLIVNGVMPARRGLAKEILELNRHYERIALDVGATFVDLWPALADPHGQEINPEFSLDRLHLNGKGYRAWVDVLRPHLHAVLGPGSGANQDA